MITPTRNNIQFTFLEKIQNGAFKNATDWGLEILAPVQDIQTPRWAEVASVGPETKSVQKGDFILIQPLMWTEQIKVPEGEFWMTNEDKVFIVTKNRPTRFT